MTRFVLETPRLVLREMGMEDRGALASILQDERVMYAYNGAFSEEETEAWLEKQLRRYREYGFGLWAAVLRDTGEMVGQCGITMQEYGGGLVPEIGYLLAYAYWHRGYAQESVSACVDYAFRTLGAGHVTAQIRPNNLPSVKVAERLGMTVRSQFVKRYRGKDMIHLIYYLEKQDEKAGNSYDQKDLH